MTDPGIPGRPVQGDLIDPGTPTPPGRGPPQPRSGRRAEERPRKNTARPIVHQAKAEREEGSGPGPTHGRRAMLDFL